MATEYSEDIDKRPFSEDEFQKWYRTWAKKAGIDPNPDSPLHHYDYRAAYRAGVEPKISDVDKKYHWPSEFKDDDHPNRFVMQDDGSLWDTKYDRPADISDIHFSRAFVSNEAVPRVGSARPSFADVATTTRAPRFRVVKPGVYVNGAEFQSLLQMADQKGVESLNQDQQRQLKAAIESGMVVEQPQIKPQMKEAGETARLLTWDYVQQHPELTKNFGTDAIEGLKNLDRWMMNATRQGGETATQVRAITGKSWEDNLQEMFSYLDLQPLPEGATKTKRVLIKQPDGSWKPEDRELPYTESDRIAQNTLRGLLRLGPSLVVGLIDNPYAFIRNIPVGIVDAITTTRDATVGNLVGSASELEVKEARDKIFADPVGVAMGWLMLVGAASKMPGGKPKRVSVPTEDFEALQKEAATARDANEAAKAPATENAKTKPTLEDVNLGELDAIRTASDNQLRDEVLSMQRGAKKPHSAAEIAAMNRAELEYRVSGGQIGTLEKPKPTPPPRVERTPVTSGEEASTPVTTKPAQVELAPAEPIKAKPVEKAPVKIEPPDVSELRKVNHDAIPGDLEVEVPAIREATGELVPMKEKASSALKSLEVDMDLFKRLWECLSK